MSRFDFVNDVLAAVHDAGLVGMTAIEICAKYGYAQNRTTAALFSLWKRSGKVKRSRDAGTGHYRYWYEGAPMFEVGNVSSAEPYRRVAPPSVVHAALEAVHEVPPVSLRIKLRPGEIVTLSLGEAREVYKTLQTVFAGS